MAQKLYCRYCKRSGRSAEHIARCQRKEVLCPCGEVAVGVSCGLPVCARCLRIEKFNEKFLRAHRHKNDSSEYDPHKIDEDDMPPF